MKCLRLLQSLSPVQKMFPVFMLVEERLTSSSSSMNYDEDRQRRSAPVLLAHDSAC